MGGPVSMAGGSSLFQESSVPGGSSLDPGLWLPVLVNILLLGSEAAIRLTGMVAS